MMMSTYVLADTPYDDWELTYESIVPGAEPSEAAHSALDYIKLISEPITYEETIIVQESDGTLSLDVGPTIEVTRNATVDATIDALIGLIGYDMFGEGVTLETITFATTDGYITEQLTDVFNAFIPVIAAQNALKQDYILTGEIVPLLDSYPVYVESIHAMLVVINKYNTSVKNYRAYIETLTELQ